MTWRLTLCMVLSCFQLPNFLVEFITPIIKATKGNQRLVFHTMPECVPAAHPAARVRLSCALH
jgi:hypothetical protein